MTWLSNNRRRDYAWRDEIRITDAISSALERDSRDEFVYLINSYSDKKEILEYAWYRLFELDSANCAAAILADEIGGVFSFGSRPSIPSLAPLHLAAALRARRMIKLFLENGFEANIKLDWDDMNLKMALPLNVALGTLRQRIGFDLLEPDDSAFKLICELSMYSLENVSLLAENTKEITHVFSKYLKEGKMVEVCALLMVACKQLLSSPTSEEDQVGFNNILEMYNFVLSEVSDWVSDKVKKELLLCLDIFDAIGDKLAAYRRLYPAFTEKDHRVYVKVLLEEAGFLVDKLNDICILKTQFRTPYDGKFGEVMEQDGLSCVHPADFDQYPLILAKLPMDRPYKRGTNKNPGRVPLASSCDSSLNEGRSFSSGPLFYRPNKEQKLIGLNRKPGRVPLSSSCVLSLKERRSLHMHHSYPWVGSFVAAVKRGARMV